MESKKNFGNFIDGFSYLVFTIGVGWIVIGILKGLGVSFNGSMISYNSISSVSCYIRGIMAISLSKICLKDFLKINIEKLIYDR